MLVYVGTKSFQIFKIIHQFGKLAMQNPVWKISIPSQFITDDFKEAILLAILQCLQLLLQNIVVITSKKNPNLIEL